MEILGHIREMRCREKGQTDVGQEQNPILPTHHPVHSQRARPFLRLKGSEGPVSPDKDGRGGGIS